MDKADTKELIAFVLKSLKLIKNRFECINTSDDFLDTDDGLI